MTLICNTKANLSSVGISQTTEEISCHSTGGNPCNPSAFASVGRADDGKMVAIRRLWTNCFVFHTATRVLAPQFSLNNEQTKHYKASQPFLRFHHGVGANFEPVQYLPHLLPAHPHLETDAWQFAFSPGNGPVLWTLDASEKKIFATTKIPSRSWLGSAWNLGWRDDSKDAYAFWHIKEEGHKLLRLDVWPEGAMVGEIATIAWILARIKRAAEVLQLCSSAAMCVGRIARQEHHRAPSLYDFLYKLLST